MNASQTFQLLTVGAIGDAYGFCFEFASPDFVARHNKLAYMQHPEFLDVEPGAYSDDTQMQLAVAEQLISGDEWTEDNLASRFVAAYKRDPRAGYAKRFRTLLDDIRTGAELIARIKPESDRNGAAMRASVIGIIADTSFVVNCARTQAAITHNTRGGIDSAIAAALMCHFLTYDLGSKDELPSYLTEHVPGHRWDEPWRGPVPVHGIITVRAALTTLLAADSLSDVLLRSVAFTGDVDSVATIACSCASMSSDFQNDIPACLHDGLESTDYGAGYLEKIDGKLAHYIKRTAS